MPLRPDNRVIPITTSPVVITLANRMNELSPSIANGILDKTTYVITGTHTMAGNITIAPNATGIASGLIYEFLYVANVTLGANTFQIFGYSMTAAQLLQNSKITARYNGSSWDVVLSSSFTESDIVTTSMILAKAITLAKMDDIATGSLIVGVSSRPTAVDFKGSGKIPIGDGTNLNAQSVSGDITISTSGVVAIGSDKVTDAMLKTVTRGTLKASDNGGIVSNLDIKNGKIAIGDGTDVVALDVSTSGYIIVGDGTTANSVPMSGDATIDATGKVTISSSGVVQTVAIPVSSAAILALNATPAIAVAAQGANKVIQVISASVYLIYNSIPYDTFGVLRLITETATNPQCVWSNVGVLYGTVTKMAAATISTISGGTETQIIANKGLYIDVETGDPLNGNSDIVVYVTFRVIDIS